MLKLDGLSLAGFKSFSDRTDILFPDGITCVVGPNGCGKSNVVDAIAWVLGEQSPRMLRGSRMEEVIFAGTRSRKPAGMAEVTLQFSPKDIPPGVDGEDVDSRLREPLHLTRRLYRNGDSEYLINGERSRLKDIQQLIAGTGMGTRVYSIIEQGRVGQILQAKPTDRRILIEEAAGITRYKAKRKAAKLKLDQSEQDLLRVTDIIAEVEKQVRSIKRQVGAAKRYRRLNGRRRVVLRALHAVRYRSLAASLSDLDRDLADLRAQAADSAEALEALETSARGAGDVVAQTEARRDHVSQQGHGLHRELDRSRHVVESSRARLAELAERIERTAEKRRALEAARSEAESEAGRAARRLEQLQEELGTAQSTLEDRTTAGRDVRDRLATAHREIAELKETIFEVMSEAAGLRNRKQEIETGVTRLEALSQRLFHALALASGEVQRLQGDMVQGETRLQKALEAENGLRAQLASVSSDLEGAVVRVTSLRRGHEEGTSELHDVEWKLAAVTETIRTRAAWGDAVKALLDEPPEGVLGAVADFVTVTPGDELAVEKALGSLLQAVVFSSREAAERAARERAGERTADISFVFPEKAGPAADGEAPRDAKVLGAVADSVTFDEDVAWIAQLVPRAWICANAKDAIALARKFPSAAFVSRDGACLGPGGRGSVGRPHGEADGILETRARGERLEKQVAERRGHVERLARELKEAESGRDALSAERLRLQVALAGGEKEALTARHAVAALRQAVQAAQSRETAARAEHEAAATEMAELTERLSELSLRLASAASRKTDLERTLGKTTELTARLEAEAEGSETEVSRLREELAVKAERREVARAEAARLAAELKMRRDEEAEAEGQVRALVADRDETAALLARAEEAIASGSAQWETLKVELDQVETAVRDGRAGLLENAERLRDLRLEHERRARLVTDAERKHERASLELEHVIADCREKLSCDPSELPNPEPPPESERAAASEGRRKRRSRAARAAEEAADAAAEAEAAAVAQAADGGITDAPAGAEASAEVDDEDADAPIDESLPWMGDELDLQALATEAEELRLRLDRVGPVNLMAIEEYEGLQARYAFLAKEQGDLVNAIRSLRATIKEIDEMSRERFTQAFEHVRVVFDQAFQTLFRGGRAELRLQEDEQDPLECGIEIIAQPPGKRLQNMMLLSGGEKALTAIALLFALFRYKPSPFCVLDEVDAPLDESNTMRFLDLVEEMARDTQFVLVTHARRSMERGKVLYGVTMQEAGCSKLVGVRFDELGEEESAA